MSSIKRDVKKKAPPRPEAERIFVSKSSPLSVCASRFTREVLLCWVCHSPRFPVTVVTLPIESWQRGKRDWYLSVNHGSIRGSWPIAISGYPRGHSVQIRDSVPKHTGPTSLTDTTLEPSVSRTRPPTTPENYRDGKASSPEMLKLLADAIVWGRSPLLSST